MKTAAVIITNSDRYHFLEKVITSILCLDLIRIIIVNNNSTSNSFVKMHKLKELHKENISVIDLDRNSGSAVAYNKGIREAIDIYEADYIWMLDDDNYPEEKSFEALKSVYLDISAENARDKIILCSYRLNRDFFYKAVKYGKPELCLGTNNTFRNFNISDILKKLNPFSMKNDIESDKKWGEVGSAPIGGMFIHRSVIENIGGFNEAFVLYFDDTEFCCRARKIGIKIYCALDSKITDLEDSFNTEVFAPYLFSTSNNYRKIYYTVRNRVYLEKKYLVSRWPVYIINMSIYLSIVYAISIFHGNLKNLKVFTRAIYDGFTGKLGYNEKYPLL